MPESNPIATDLSGEGHPDAMYSPEVFEAMHGYLAKASGSPMLALRLVLSERLTAPPADDEREAIMSAIDAILNPFDRGTDAQERMVLDAAKKWANCRRGPITDAEVEIAFREWRTGTGPWQERMRSALEAARAVS